MMKFLKALIPHKSPIRLLWHKIKAFLAARKYGYPAKDLTVIGITGTDGKTTTVGMAAHILQRTKGKTGALSTAFFRRGDNVEWNATQKTSPSPGVIQEFLRSLVDANCTYAVLEYSSHGLVQGRTNYTWPSVAAITNTSAEHLDYHGTLKQYRYDKGILFQMLDGEGVKVLNYEDETCKLYADIPSENTIIYSAENQGPFAGADTSIWTTDIDATPKGTTALVHMQHDGVYTKTALTLSMPGAFNVQNALCAIACCVSQGVAIEKAVTALGSFTGVPGRMERIDEGQNFSVFIDFTVTPAAYEHTLSTLKSMLKGDARLLILTGSCGDRMKEKRPLIGKICSEIADVVVVTNEDPYTEDPQKIIDEVWAGIDQDAVEARQIFDRREAMQFLIDEARAGDIVVFCAKGSDTTMWVKDGQIPWNEREITRELLKERTQ